jgi:hypothetical protein
VLPACLPACLSGGRWEVGHGAYHTRRGERWPAPWRSSCWCWPSLPNSAKSLRAKAAGGTRSALQQAAGSRQQAAGSRRLAVSRTPMLPVVARASSQGVRSPNLFIQHGKCLTQHIHMYWRGKRCAPTAFAATRPLHGLPLEFTLCSLSSSIIFTTSR